MQAAEEFCVVSPLTEAGLSKEELRIIAKHLDITIWDKPASPCLASRIPYHNDVTPEKLAVIDQAETFLKQLAIRELRVRHFGTTARIDVAPKNMSIVHDNMEQIQTFFYSLGFAKVETHPFKSGALNKLIQK